MLTREQRADYNKAQSKASGGNICKSYYKHGVVYGDYFDLRIYTNVKNTYYPADTNREKRRQGAKRDDSIARARVQLYRLVQANVGKHGRYRPIFATYTFKDNITDLSRANSYYKQYATKLRYHIGKNPEYVVVPEQQQRGAWHFHTVFFNLPKIDPKLNDALWGQGDYAVKLEYVRGIRNVAAYLAKYLSEDFLANRPLNSKFYRSSAGLIRPYDVFHHDIIDNLLDMPRIKVLSTYQGVSYSQIKYKLN